jgi:hypothetical protein
MSNGRNLEHNNDNDDGKSCTTNKTYVATENATFDNFVDEENSEP